MPSAAPASEYQYDFDNAAVPGVPMPKFLPDEEKPSKAFKAVENSMRFRLAVNAAIATLGLRPWQHLADFAKVWRVDPPSPVVRTWSSDTEFARQRLAGMEPSVIRLVTDPKDYPALPDVPNETIQRQLGLDTSFRALLEEGKILICDYRRLDGYTIRSRRYFAAPIAVFAWSKSRPDRPDRLMPLAIRLGQRESDPVFLPDASEAWQVAKFFVQVADGTHGDMVSHLVRSHFAATPFVISTKRILPVGHVVRTILEPHMQFSLMVNSRFPQFSAQFLYGQLMPFSKTSQQDLMRDVWEDWDFEERTFERDLEDRKVTSGGLLRDYPYRDDGRSVWEPTRKYVEDVLRHHYADDTAVDEDKHLQAWIDDLQQNGRVRGLKPRIETRDYLEHVVANTLFHFGPKHAAVHTPAADYGIFAPNISNSAWQPSPTGSEDVMHLIEYLPGRMRSVFSFALHYAITEIKFGQYGGYSDGFTQALARSPDSWPTGYTKDSLIAADKQLGAAADAMTMGLVGAENTILERNKHRMYEVDGEYTFLIPSNLPNSIYA